MLSEIKIENFKCLEKIELTDLKPLILFCGKNNTGKSSILQSILFLQSSLDNNKMMWDNEYIKLGSFEDVVFKHDLSKSISIFINFKLTDEQKVKWSLKDEIGILYEFEKGYLKDFLIGENKNGYRSLEGKIIKIKNGSPQNIDEITVGLLSPNIRELPLSGNSNTINEVKEFIYPKFQVFKSLKYYAPDPTIHEWDAPISKLQPIGIHGENVISNLHYYQSADNPVFWNIEKVLNDFDISMEKTRSPVRETGVSVEGESRGIKSNINLFGNGVGNLLTIITSIESADIGDTLMFEEPEMHLNRGTIRKLAEYFARASKKGVQILCITHSFDLLNTLWKMIYRRSRKEITKDDLSLFKFIERGEDEKFISVEEVKFNSVHKKWRDELKEIFG